MQTAGNQQQRSQKKKKRRPAHGQHSAEPGTAGGSPTERGASRGPRGLREYNLQVLGGIIGQPHRDLRPQGAATQSTGAGCIVHPTQVHAFAVRASYPRALSCSLYTVPWTRGWWSRPTDRPSGGDQGWNSITDSRGGIFIAEVTSIHPPIHHGQAVGSCCCCTLWFCLCALPPSPSLAIRRPGLPSASALRPVFFFSTLGTFTCCTAPFPGHPSSYPHSHLTIKQFQILDGSPLYLLGCYLVPSIRSRPSTLDPRDLVTPSIKSRCCPPGHANPSDHPSFKNTNQPNPGSPFV